MNGASKILTVSYGTFSCTLEGFDDPFSTMKAIAEYFRDLAADDRYFGAEPPTPDAAMLHRIAEREIQRRVEAKVGEHGVVLRAGDAAAPQVAATVAQAPAAPAVVAAPIATPTVTPEPEPVAPSVAPLAEAGPQVESAAARLSRLRAAQAQIQSQAAGSIVAPVAAPVATPAAPAYVEDQEPAAPAPAPAPAIEASAEAPADETVLRVLSALDAAPAPDATPEPEIRPEAALRETLAGLMAQDDQLIEDIAEAATVVVAPAIDSLPEDLLPEAEPEPFEAEAGHIESAAFEPVEADDLAAADAEATAADAAAPAAFAETVAEEPAFANIPEAEVVEESAPLIDDAAYLAPEAAPAASVELALADEKEAAPEAKPVIALVTEPEAAAEDEPMPPEVAAKLQRARARVIKVRRLDKSGQRKPAATGSALSPEDEEDLQKTLAALAAEAVPPARPVAPVAEPVAEAEPAPAPRPASSPLTATADASVDRLLAETNQQLEVPDVKRRRSAIAHLKAAVLATVADRRANNRGKEDEAKADPYRADLDKVVRPLPSAPVGDRPAPLVLVSAQRIDRPAASTTEAGARPMPHVVSSTPAPVQTMPGLPIRPRRVTSGGTSLALSGEFDDEDDGSAPDMSDAARQSFADFAESLGARSLPELLEAAGAYCTLVLDRPSFTRPFLFDQIAKMPQMAESKREDSLRNFGKLLREGRFQKTMRGQFALAETSPILTEAKRLAG